MIEETKIKKILKEIPGKPGVYKFLNKKEEVIYVGKAKNLKNRVKSYFQASKDKAIKTRVMLKKAEDLEYTIVDSELEAIMLETNLIKELRPKYNVLMKDDKNFTYIKITTQEEYPMIYIVRNMVNDGSIYFGPKTSSFDIRKTLKMASAFFPYPKCKLNVQTLKDGKVKKRNKSNKKYPCEIYQLDQGHAPCISTMPSSEYKEIINSVIDLLKGKHTQLLSQMRTRMKECAENKDFEQAASIRDYISSMEKIVERQKISVPSNEEIDVIDIIGDQGKYFSNIFQIREGRLIGQENFIITNEDDREIREVFEGFLTQYYSQAGSIPKTIIIPEKLESLTVMELWLEKVKGSKVKIEIPKIGRKHKLIKLATKNATSYAKQMRIKWMSEEKHDPIKQIKSLKEILKLDKIPYRIECYDISHLQGTETVGSMVVFENGVPKKSDYRIFNIKSLEEGGIDDFQSMYEVLKRRLKYISDLPNELKIKKKKDTLILINGKDELIKLAFDTKDSEIHINELEIIDENYKDLIERFLRGSIKKLKSEKYLFNPNEFLQEAINAGFIEIDHPEYSHGYYAKKQNDKSFTTAPDLILIDGGKGQLSSAVKARNEKGLSVPVISIAKKNEEVYKEDKTKITLEATSSELNLIQRLRDEAHRFAIERNRKNRINKLKRPTD